MSSYVYKHISLITFRDSEGLLERNTEAVLKAARLGDVPMLTQLRNEVRLNLNPFLEMPEVKVRRTQYLQIS